MNVIECAEMCSEHLYCLVHYDVWAQLYGLMFPYWLDIF